MNLRQKAVKGVVWVATQNLGSQAISFIVFLLLARLLEPKVFGLLALASVFFAFMQVFLDQGFAEAIVQRHELDSEHLDTAFWTNLGIGVLLTVLGVAAAGSVANLFNQPQLVPIIRWLSLSFLFGAFSSVQQAILSRRLAFKDLALRSLIAALAGGVVGVSAAFQGFGVWSLVSQQLVNGLVGVVVLWRASDWRPGLNISTKHFKELFTFGISVMGTNMLNFFNRRADDFLIGYFLGPVALGYYAVAYRVLLVVSQLLIGTMNSLSMPIFSRLQKEPERLRQALYKAINLTSLGALPVFFGLSTLAPEIVVLVFGEQWTPSIPVMQVLFMMGLLYSGFYFNGPLIMALGKPSWNFWLNFLQAVGNVIAFAIAVRWGIVAVAAAYVIYGYLMSPAPLWVLRRLLHIELKVYLRQFTVPLLGSLVMVISIYAVKHLLENVIGSYALLAVCIGVGALVYALIILLIAPTLFRQVLDLIRLALPEFGWKKN